MLLKSTIFLLLQKHKRAHVYTYTEANTVELGTTSAFQMSTVGPLRPGWCRKRDNTAKKELNISSAFLIMCLRCLDCAVPSTACLFNRLGSQIPYEANITLEWRRVDPIIATPSGKGTGKGGLEAHVLTYLCSQCAGKFSCQHFTLNLTVKRNRKRKGHPHDAWIPPSWGVIFDLLSFRLVTCDFSFTHTK